MRSRNAFSQIGAGFKSMFGGELQGMTKNLAESRNEAMVRLMNEARNKGGNAIIGMRFDTTELGDVWTEICAYGTAVQAVPVTDAARYTASQLGYGGPQPQPQQPQPYGAG
ncbi:heavy-metal-binding family protein [Mycobacterium kansasii 824]|nr:heavy-metal-binding family protein [Mycobacterium kansasii 824]